MKTYLTTEDGIADAVYAGETVYWRNENSTVIHTTNTLKVRTAVNNERYIVAPLYKIIDVLGIGNDFYTINEV